MLYFSLFSWMNDMGTVNTQSVREETDRLKLEFERLADSGKMSAEIKALFQSMIMLVNLLVAIFLEKRTPKHQKNSSKPSSQTQKDESFVTQPGAKGKGKEETSETVGNRRTIESVTVSKVSVCDVCGKDLGKLPCQGHERRTKIDIVFEKIVEHVDAQIKQCPECDTTVKGHFPLDMPGTLQYGPGLKAYVINLVVGQMISLNRIQKLIKSMIGILIAEATILKFVLRLYLALEAWEVNAVETLLKQTSLHVDETSLRVDKKNHWVHVYSAGEMTVKCLHRRRGTEAIDAINVIPRYSGVMIHDFWSSYLTYDHCVHGMCGAHIVRELTAIQEANGYQWAKNIKALLLETCKTVSRRRSKKLTPREYATLQRRYRNILTRGESELPPIPPKPNGRRGKMAKSDAHNLWERLKEYESAVLLFAQRSDVAFTNNRAERDLRMAKVKQKISGCFRNEIYAKAYCRISSYLQTMANKGYNPLIAIQIALAGDFEHVGGE